MVCKHIIHKHANFSVSSDKFSIAIWSVLLAVPKICTFFAIMQLLSRFSQLSIYILTFCGLQPEYDIKLHTKERSYPYQDYQAKIIKDNVFPVTTV